jgi:site-specific recombinase XerD
MPHSTDVEKRDRALVACILLTGARVMAVTTLKLKHVRADRLGIDQRAEEVRTKFSRSYTTVFFPVGDDIREIFFDYVDYLRHELKLNGEDPLLPLHRTGDRRRMLFPHHGSVPPTLGHGGSRARRLSQGFWSR